MQTLLEWRKHKDEHFRSERSPLRPEQREAFAGLHYFAPDPQYQVVARWQPDPQQTHVMIATTTGLNREHQRLGWLEFELHGQTLRLAGYATEHNPNTLFVPFQDASNKTTTCLAGRYLEFDLTGQNLELQTGLEVDFNWAYSPYCAHNEAWSCPIPPAENRLEVMIEAGERR